MFFCRILALVRGGGTERVGISEGRAGGSDTIEGRNTLPSWGIGIPELGG